MSYNFQFDGYSELSFALFKPLNISHNIYHTSDVHITATGENIVWYSPGLRLQTIQELEYHHVWIAQHRTQNLLTKPIFVSKNFYGTAIHIEHSFQQTFLFRRTLMNSITDTNYIFVSKAARNTLLGPTSLTAINVETRILLDGLDVTDKIASCTVSYSLNSFVGEVDVAWADPSMYSQVDCSNIPKNYMIERLEVYTRLTTNETPVWVCQGKFFLEKRGTSVSFGSTQLTSWGRNRPAVLSMPYAKPLSRTWSTDTTAKSIATELCSTPELPVTLSWEILDYKVLASNLTVDGDDPVSVISTLAATVGGILTSNRDGVLRVIYRYPLDGVAIYTPQPPDPPQIVGATGGDQQAVIYFS